MLPTACYFLKCCPVFPGYLAGIRRKKGKKGKNLEHIYLIKLDKALGQFGFTGVCFHDKPKT